MSSETAVLPGSPADGRDAAVGAGAVPPPPAHRPGRLAGVARRVLGSSRYDALRVGGKLASRRELALPYPLGFKLRAWARGFTVEHAVIYDLDRRDAREYLNDYARKFRCPALNPLPALFDHKLLLRRLLADRGFVQPETVAHLTRSTVVLDPLGEARQVDRQALQARLVAEGGAYILKPENGTYGQGILRLEVRDGALVARRGTSVRPFGIVRDAPADSLVERLVEQHPFWERLSPHSVNTMRILTLWTPGDAEPFVARAIQRMGTVETAPTDNWDGGGVACPIDLATGRLGPGRVNPFRSAREDRHYTHHPDTGAPLDGVELPFWSEILATTLRAARSLPMASYIGWDVAVDAAGRPLFIEGNRNTGVRSLQLWSGLLADPRVRRFYEVSGVV